MAADATAPSLPVAALPHVVIFPFMAKGHTIPLLHLAHLLHRRHLATFSFFTTPLNAPFIRRALADLPPEAGSVLELPFPRDAPGLPPGVESTDRLPSMSLFLSFVGAAKRLRPDFERALGGLLPRASFLIFDFFLGWTVEAARDLGIPGLVFTGMGWYATMVSMLVAIGRPHAGVTSEVEPFRVPGFPHIQLTKADLNPPFDDPDARGPMKDFVMEQTKAMTESRGIVMNSFYEMESAFVDHWDRHVPLRAWCVGPLCLALPEARSLQREYAEWLDARSAKGRPVLYVSFGTQAEISALHLGELSAALESSGLDFLWVLRPNLEEGGSSVVDAGFEERVAGRGLVVREWVPQTEVLAHAAVRGFLSHCGWNSILESVCAGVPILAWPMMAEQHLNAKLVAEELGIGLRILTSDGTREGLVRRECIEETARTLLAGEKGREAAKRVEELAGAALRAMEGGGSSWCALEGMVDEVSGEVGSAREGESPAVGATHV